MLLKFYLVLHITDTPIKLDQKMEILGKISISQLKSKDNVVEHSKKLMVENQEKVHNNVEL